MKKISPFLFMLLLSHSIYAQNIKVEYGWQLLGATEDINVSIFDNSCVDYIWQYNHTNIENQKWLLHISNNQTYNYTGGYVTNILAGSGFWVKGNTEIGCDVNTSMINQKETIVFLNKTYNSIVSPYTGRTWLDRNIGANKVCSSYNDVDCYGDYFQWGRDADGHQESNSSMVSEQAIDIDNNGTDFISISWTTGDWTTGDVNGSLRSLNWSKIDGTSVCPIGYRVPTITELENETINNGVTQNITAYENFLKLPSAGYRSSVDGLLIATDSRGYIWSSSDLSPYAAVIYFDPSQAYTSNNTYRSSGLSVRCIKN
ncbi:MAG: hypothetical protein JXQ66_01830 [Campylobacterales bacterium]|nr:hypothetical protein [Campylobacterales bacterium]